MPDCCREIEFVCNNQGLFVQELRREGKIDDVIIGASPHLPEAAASAASNHLAWDHTFPPASAFEFDQRISWCDATAPSRLVRAGGRCSQRGIPGSGRGPVRLLRAGTRQNTESLPDCTAKTDIDHDQAVKDTRAWPLNCLFS